MKNRARKTRGGWKPGIESAKRRFKMRMDNGKYWRDRWRKSPEFMAACLAKTQAKNQERWKSGRDRLRQICNVLPRFIEAGMIRAYLASAIKHVDGIDEPTKPQVQAALVSMRRHCLIAFDNVTLQWSVAMPSQ